PLSDLLALQDAAALPRRRRLVHLSRGDQAADAGRERDRRMDAAVLRPAHGRLAAEHGGLEHLSQALLRAPASLLSLQLRAREPDRLPRRAGGAGDRRARATAGVA